ncbi:MAG: hypothetical protein WED34_12190 [Planctomycetales bacterium]
MKAIAAAILCAGLGFGAVAADDEAREDRLIRPPVPAPVPVPAPAWKLAFQEKPQFPGEPQGEVSAPASQEGLSVTVQPELKEFSPFGPLAFRVVLKNTSDKPLRLASADQLGGKVKLVISHRQTGAQWTLESAAEKGGAAKRLGPGESLEVTLIVQQDRPIVRPLPPGRPIPLPEPIPVPGPVPLPVDKLRAEAPAILPPAAAQPSPVPEDAEVRGVFRRRRPIILPGPVQVIGTTVPCGTGPCRAMLFLEFAAGDRTDKAFPPLWNGKLASEPVDFTVTAAGGAVRPPIIIQPATKEQAVQFALPAAERALNANYQPIPDVRPAHDGAWIADAEKTASVTERKEGGWTVRWTHAPSSGFSYNVTVDVETSGAVVVREVFAGYSAR